MVHLGLGMNDKKRVLVLGVTGMLGSMVDAVLRLITRYGVIGTARQVERHRHHVETPGTSAFSRTRAISACAGAALVPGFRSVSARAEAG